MQIGVTIMLQMQQVYERSAVFFLVENIKQLNN